MASDLPENKRLAFKALFLASALVQDAIDVDMDTAHVGTKADYDVLYTLYNAEGMRLRLNELADMVTLSPSGLSRRVDHLEKRGWVRREGCDTDKRSFYAVLTEDGEKALDRMWEVYSQTIDRAFASQITDAEAATIRSVFSRIAHALHPDRAAFYELTDDTPDK